MRALIVGCGALGYRYFQSLVKCHSFCHILLCDPRKPVWHEISDSHAPSVSWVSSIDYIAPGRFDFVILSTQADVRFRLLSKILTNLDVQFLLLEKFLFLETSEYDEASDVVGKSGTLAFVNEWPSAVGWFRRAVLAARNGAKGSQLCIKVDGYKWGLASNAVHFVGLFRSVLKLSKPIEFIDGRVRSIYETKRVGASDICGSLSFRCGSVKLELESRIPDLDNVDWNDDLFMTLTDGKEPITAIEIKREDTRIIMDKRNIYGGVESFPPVYLSSYMSEVIRGLIEHRSCDLPSYAESRDSHVAVLAGLEVLQQRDQVASFKFT